MRQITTSPALHDSTSSHVFWQLKACVYLCNKTTIKAYTAPYMSLSESEVTLINTFRRRVAFFRYLLTYLQHVTGISCIRTEILTSTHL